MPGPCVRCSLCRRFLSKLSYTFPFTTFRLSSSARPRALPHSHRRVAVHGTRFHTCTRRVPPRRSPHHERRAPLAARLTRVDPLDAFGSSSNASSAQRRTSVPRTPRSDQSPAPSRSLLSTSSSPAQAESSGLMRVWFGRCYSSIAIVHVYTCTGSLSTKRSHFYTFPSAKNHTFQTLPHSPTNHPEIKRITRKPSVSSYSYI